MFHEQIADLEAHIAPALDELESAITLELHQALLFLCDRLSDVACMFAICHHGAHCAHGFELVSSQWG